MFALPGPRHLAYHRRWWAHLRNRSRRPTAAGTAITVLASSLVAIAVIAVRHDAEAAEPPAGGIIASAPNFGWTDGDFSVSGDGAARYTVPLEVPEGRGQVAPELSLSYDSNAGNGLAGVGWSLTGLSSISWCPRTIAQDGQTDGGHYDGTDPLCLGGNRLILTSGGGPFPQQTYRTEEESFSRITGYGTEDGVPDRFVVEAKDGRILTFGKLNDQIDERLRAFRLRAKPNVTEPTLERESTTDRVTVAWLLTTIGDRNGNTATIRYTHSEGNAANLWYAQALPDNITYAPNRTVKFVPESRPDPIDAFYGGVHTRTTSRIGRIEMHGQASDGTPLKLREYRLAYLPASSDSITGRSLLSSITDCDGAGACKRPITFDWSKGGYGFEMLDHDADLPRETERTRISVLDADGDGRSDLLLDEYGLRRGTGTWFTAPADPGEPTGEHAKPIDVDADGRSELLDWVFDGENGVGKRWKLYQWNGTGYVLAPGANLGEWRFDPPPHVVQPAYMADLNGDALPDFVDARFDGGTWSYRINTGSAGADRFAPRRATDPAFVRTGRFGHLVVDTDSNGRSNLVTNALAGATNSWGLFPTGNGAYGAVPNLWGNDLLWAFGDVNGDGLEDAVLPYRTSNTDPGQLRVQLGSGNGYASRLSAPSPTGYQAPPFHSGYFDHGVRVVDFNRDGRDDVLVFHPDTPGGEDGLDVWEWTGTGFVRTPINLGVGFDRPSGWTNTQVLDIDGDGMLDIVNAGPDDNVENTNNRLRVFRRLGGVPDRLTGIGNTTYRGRVEIDYTTLADRDVHAPATGCTFPLTCPATGGTIVKQHRVTSDFSTGTTFTWDRYNHTYSGARTELRGRGWLGFAQHTVTRVATGATTVTEFDNAFRHDATKTYPKAHLPKKTTYTVVDKPGTDGREFRGTVVNEYNVRRFDSLTHTVELNKVTASEEERPVGGAWQVLRTITTVSTFDDFGNPDVVTSTTTNGRKLTVDTDYDIRTNAWLISLPDRRLSTGCDAAGACVTREVGFDHDDFGNPKVLVVEPNKPAMTLTATTAFGQFGVVDSVTLADATGNSRRDRFEYNNADKLHPTDAFNALDHHTVIVTDPGLGVPTSITDPNGVKTTMRYDRFGRLRETYHSDGSSEIVTHANLGNRQQSTTTLAGGGVTSTVVDQLGREREKRVNAFDGRTAVTFTNYDTLGRGPAQVSRPVLPAATVFHYTTTAYDNRGRVTAVTAPDNAQVRHEYNNRETHTIDAKGVRSYTVENADGDIEASHEDDPGSTAWLTTAFQYGAFGETTRITPPDGNAQVMHYDSLGRRDQLTDPASGTTATPYTPFGEVHTKTTATGAVSTYTYDDLGRVTRVGSPDGPATYTWDTAEHGLGKLHSADSPDNVFTRYTYDELGHPTVTATKIENETFEVVTGYDQIGRVSSTTYPQVHFPGGYRRLRVDHVYNQYGYLSQIKDAAPGGPVYWTALGRDLAGQLTKERFGNGVVGDYTYLQATGLPDVVTVTGPGSIGKLSEIDYGYDPNRNVTVRHDKVNGRYEQYFPDELNRLKRWQARPTATGAPVLTADYAYDPMGNLKTETTTRPGQPVESIGFEHGYDHPELGAPPNALVARAGNRAYAYDAAGRQVTGPNRQVTYTTADLPRTLDTNNGKHVQFAYDAAGARALRRDNDTTTITAGEFFERRSPAGHASSEIHNLNNIIVDGRIVAQVNLVQPAGGGEIIKTVPVYLHADRQGTTTLITGPNGEPYQGDDSIYSNLFYDPWGRRIDDNYQQVPNNRTSGPRQLYTGHYHDDHIDLINMKGRMYDPHDHRFLTVDPVIANPLSSQDHNPYAYVRNNPTTLTDPTGHLPRNRDWGAASAGDVLDNNYGPGCYIWHCPDPGAPLPEHYEYLAARAASIEFAFYYHLINRSQAMADDDTSSAGLNSLGNMRGGRFALEPEPVDLPGTITIEIEGNVTCDSFGVCTGWDDYGVWVRYPGDPKNYYWDGGPGFPGDIIDPDRYKLPPLPRGWPDVRGPGPGAGPSSGGAGGSAASAPGRGGRFIRGALRVGKVALHVLHRVHIAHQAYESIHFLYMLYTRPTPPLDSLKPARDLYHQMYGPDAPFPEHEMRDMLEQVQPDGGGIRIHP